MQVILTVAENQTLFKKILSVFIILLNFSNTCHNFHNLGLFSLFAIVDVCNYTMPLIQLPKKKTDNATHSSWFYLNFFSLILFFFWFDFSFLFLWFYVKVMTQMVKANVDFFYIYILYLLLLLYLITWIPLIWTSFAVFTKQKK